MVVINEYGQDVIVTFTNSATMSIYKDAYKNGIDIDDLGEDLVTGEEYDVISIEKNGKYALANWKGNLTRYTFDQICEVANGLVRVQKGNKWGIVNLQGKTVVSFDYDLICSCYKNYYAVAVKKKQWIYPSPMSSFNYMWGIMDVNGKLTCPLIYDNIIITETTIRGYKISEGEKHFFLIDEKGNVIEKIN
jgi:hypothetical protein